MWSPLCLWTFDSLTIHVLAVFFALNLLDNLWSSSTTIFTSFSRFGMFSDIFFFHSESLLPLCRSLLLFEWSEHELFWYCPKFILYFLFIPLSDSLLGSLSSNSLAFFKAQSNLLWMFSVAFLLSCFLFNCRFFTIMWIIIFISIKFFLISFWVVSLYFLVVLWVSLKQIFEFSGRTYIFIILESITGMLFSSFDDTTFPSIFLNLWSCVNYILKKWVFILTLTRGPWCV